MYSAKAPSDCSPVMLLRFSHWEGLPSGSAGSCRIVDDGTPTTSSPISQSVTASPMAAMLPLHSWPGHDALA